MRHDLAPWIAASGLGDPEAVLRDSPREGAGRGGVARVRAPGGGFVLKKYRRGGALAPLLPDLFAGRGRMIADLLAGARARARGVPCAAPGALFLRRRAGLLWEGYLLSEEVEGAVTLARALGAPSALPGGAGGGRRPVPDDGPAGARRLASAAVALVRRLHDAGIIHRDLNLGNLLVRGGELFIIDLDGARLVENPGTGLRFSNLSRLDRSYVKLFGGAGPLDHGERRALLGEYCGGDDGMLRELERALPAHKRALRRHGLLWPSPRV